MKTVKSFSTSVTPSSSSFMKLWTAKSLMRKSLLSEIDVTADMLVKGDRLMDLPLPDDELVVTVKRDDTFFIPNGRSKLYLNDKLMIISHSKKNPDTEVPDSNTPSEPAS